MLEAKHQFVSRVVSSALLIGSSLLPGCQGQEYQTQKLDETVVISEELAPFLLDKFPDPIYRAGSLILFTKGGSFGQGSLVQREGKLYIYTIGHVVDGLKEEGDSYVNIPGLPDPIRKLDLDNFHYHPQTITYDDRIVSYKINDVVQKEIEAVVNQGGIAPLEIDQSGVSTNAYVAVPRADVGRNTWMRFTGIGESGTMQLQIENMGVVCTGRSGGPVLKTLGENITKKVTGILSAVPTSSQLSDPQGLRNSCFGKAIATPINDP